MGGPLAWLGTRLSDNIGRRGVTRGDEEPESSWTSMPQEPAKVRLRATLVEIYKSYTIHFFGLRDRHDRTWVGARSYPVAVGLAASYCILSVAPARVGR